VWPVYGVCGCGATVTNNRKSSGKKNAWAMRGLETQVTINENARLVYPKESGDWTRGSGVSYVTSLAKGQSESADVVVSSGKLSSAVLKSVVLLACFSADKEGCDIVQFIY
jgi:hypothetical protein